MQEAVSGAEHFDILNPFASPVFPLSAVSFSLLLFGHLTIAATVSDNFGLLALLAKRGKEEGPDGNRGIASSTSSLVLLDKTRQLRQPELSFLDSLPESSHCLTARTLRQGRYRFRFV